MHESKPPSNNEYAAYQETEHSTSPNIWIIMDSFVPGGHFSASLQMTEALQAKNAHVSLITSQKNADTLRGMQPESPPTVLEITNLVMPDENHVQTNQRLQELHDYYNVNPPDAIIFEGWPLSGRVNDKLYATFLNEIKQHPTHIATLLRDFPGKSHEHNKIYLLPKFINQVFVRAGSPQLSSVQQRLAKYKKYHDEHVYYVGVLPPISDENSKDMESYNKYLLINVGQSYTELYAQQQQKIIFTILDQLENIPKSFSEIKIVLPHGFPKELLQLIQEHPLAAKLQITFAPPQSQKEFQKILKGAEFAISTAGDTSTELILQGIPCLLIPFKQNSREQYSRARTYHEHALADFIYPHELDDPSVVQASLQNMLNRDRAQLRTRAASILHPNGANTLAVKLLQTLNEKEEKNK